MYQISDKRSDWVHGTFRKLEKAQKCLDYLKNAQGDFFFIENKKQITFSTIKSFILKNLNNLQLKILSEFDSMDDCVRSVRKEFKKIEFEREDKKILTERYNSGIKDAFFPRDSSFTEFKEDNFIGYEIMNCCGRFVLAISEGDPK